MEQFIDFFETIKNDFEERKKYYKIDCKNNESIVWPDGYGVYLIWKKSREYSENLIYIGMTGTFVRTNDNVTINNSKFSTRKDRWTPYRFCENNKDKDFKYTFRYGPKESKTNEQERIKYDIDAYRNTISYDDLVIDCFIIEENDMEYSPALLESMLLTKFLKSNNTLPIANNKL